MKYKDSIPERWTEYIPIGSRIPGTRFIAFKVPLKNRYDSKLAPWQRFSTSDLIKEVEKQNEELGLIIDLTCTMRYYSPQELPQTVMYSKIVTVGKEVPSDEVIAQFKCAVKEFLSQNAENDKLVGVHCTHGLNRTGYLVCRYLIDVLSMEPSEAIEKFNSSRGHSIERSNYINDLLHGKSRSNAGLDKPQAGHQQHFSRKNADSGPPPYPEEPPWSHGHSYNTPRWGPRFPEPPSVQPSMHQQPGPMMRPRHGGPHFGGRYPSHGPRMPPSSFPHPHMPGPRHSLPQMEGNQPRNFRGPVIPRHHLQRPFTQRYDAANGAPPQDSRPRFYPQRNDNPGNRVPVRPPHSQPHSDSGPYQRHPIPVHKQKPKTQWQ